MAERDVVLIVGPDAAGGGGIHRGVADRLAAEGRTVAVVAGADVDLTDAAAVRVALEDVTAPAGLSAVGVVVLAPLDPSSFEATPLVELGEPAWDDAVERSLRSAIVVLQQVGAGVADGSRIVLLLPTVAATGVAGLVPLCTAIEGIRVMGKALARRWGERSITVNTIEVDLAAYMLGDVDPSTAAVPVAPLLGEPALPARSAVGDVAGLIEMLGTGAAAGLTGALLVADRGTVMQP